MYYCYYFDYFIWIFYEGNDFYDLVNEQKKTELMPNTFKKENNVNMSEKEKLLFDLIGKDFLIGSKTHQSRVKIIEIPKISVK